MCFLSFNLLFRADTGPAPTIAKIKYKEVYKLIDSSICLDAPYTIKEGNVIKKGYSSELDELKSINLDSKNYILSLEAREKERTGINGPRQNINAQS